MHARQPEAPSNAAAAPRAPAHASSAASTPERLAAATSRSHSSLPSTHDWLVPPLVTLLNAIAAASRSRSRPAATPAAAAAPIGPKTPVGRSPARLGLVPVGAGDARQDGVARRHRAEHRPLAEREDGRDDDGPDVDAAACVEIVLGAEVQAPREPVRPTSWRGLPDGGGSCGEERLGRVGAGAGDEVGEEVGAHEVGLGLPGGVEGDVGELGCDAHVCIPLPQRTGPSASLCSWRRSTFP